MYGYYNNYSPYQQQNTDERIWVQNRMAAEAYLVAPNSFVRLWDSSDSIFYEKQTDSSGRPMPMKCYRYEEIVAKMEENEEKGINTYLDRLNGLERRIIALEKGDNYADESNAVDAGI